MEINQGTNELGVTSIAVTGQPQLTGDVTISAGLNIVLTQVGNNIEIATSGVQVTLTNGNGTTINTDRVDWGGALVQDTTIDGGGSYSTFFTQTYHFGIGDSNYNPSGGWDQGFITFDSERRLGWIGDYAGVNRHTYVSVSEDKNDNYIKINAPEGKINLYDDTTSAATNGFVWTLTDNSTGQGAWAVAPTISLSTDGTPNPTQNILNLVSGTNITLTDDGSGNVTIDASGGSGGVTGIIGTTNQVLANGTSGSSQTGSVTLTLPQSIATTSNVTFGGLVVTNKLTLGSQNTLVGQDAGLNIVAGASQNTFMGAGAGKGGTMTSAADSNVAVGFNTLYSLTTGTQNVALGDSTLFKLTTGSFNFGLGTFTLYDNVSGDSNVAIGRSALRYCTGSSNVAIGREAGFNGVGVSGNVFLGHNAGYNETTSNKLYIANSNTATPLIYGDFSSSLIRVHGRLGALATTEQLRLEYSSTKYFSTTVNSVGSTTFDLTGTSPTFTFSKAVTFSESITMADGKDIVLNTTTGTKIGTATTQKLAFFNSTPVVKPTALTTQLTTITATAPGTPDYAIQDLVNVGGYGFVTADEGQSVLKVIENLQTRVSELETKLQSLGLLS